MGAVLSPHELGALTTMVEQAQARNAHELRAAKVQGGRQRRVSGVIVPLWVLDELEEGEDGNPAVAHTTPRGAEAIVNDLEELLDTGTTYKIQGTTKGGHEILKTVTISTTDDAPPVATTPGQTDMGGVAWATLRALTAAPKMTGELAEVIANRARSVLAALEERAEDQYTLGHMQARLKYEPKEDAEAVAARWAAIAGMVNMAATNPDVKDGIAKALGAISKGFGAGVESTRQRWSQRAQGEKPSGTASKKRSRKKDSGAGVGS